MEVNGGGGVWGGCLAVCGGGGGLMVHRGWELQMTWQQLAGAEVQSRPSLEPPPRWMLTEMVFSHRGS